MLSNAQDNQAFTRAVRARLLELVYGQPEEADAALVRSLGQMQQAALEQMARLQPRLDFASELRSAGNATYVIWDPHNGRPFPLG